MTIDKWNKTVDLQCNYCYHYFTVENVDFSEYVFKTHCPFCGIEIYINLRED